MKTLSKTLAEKRKGCNGCQKRYEMYLTQKKKAKDAWRRVVGK